ncbi:hypothetical protein DUNSADRAFT_18087 [Dunaliella salina]|uniref:SAM domain-containing protein n=1 Tax=Dunaliella salina TaxID=3046 RepID=A0ABQ7G0P8_DUNSA|nr:hypothetical protein DUNSADRAFT_18087 [Dunaliella salina]|eukprot:KAF5828181.1 hypothetical protein DUNSADRAFT_18087 [Dunaliella salina]
MAGHELPVFIEGQSVPTCAITTANWHHSKQSLLSTCQQLSASCEELSSLAWFVDERGARVPADVGSPAEAVLSALPCNPCALVFASSRAPKVPDPQASQDQPSCSTSQQDQTSAKNSSRNWRQKWRRRLGKAAITGIKVIVVAEATSFLLGRARLLRYMGRQERWGPSSDTVSEDSEVGTSSEAADLLLDYMQDEVGFEALQGFSPEQMDRALNKINSEDLAELGVPDAHEQLALIRATIKEGNEAQGIELQGESSTTKERDS